jgi:hypothetical protein
MCISKSLSLNNTCPCCRSEIAEKVEQSDDDYEYEEDVWSESDDSEHEADDDEELPILDIFTKNVTDVGYTMRDMVRYITTMEFGRNIKSENDNQETEEEFEERMGKIDDIYEETVKEYKQKQDELSHKEKKLVTLTDEEYKHFQFGSCSYISFGGIGEEVNDEIVNKVYGYHLEEEDYKKVVDRRSKDMLEEIAKLCTMLKKKPTQKNPEPEVRFRAGYKFYPELKRFVSTFVVDEKYYDRLLEI